MVAFQFLNKNLLSLLLSLFFELKNELAQIDLNKKLNTVVFGSIVKTNQENYFISIGLGVINIQQEIFYAISLASPIGKVLNRKKVGDEVSFLGKKILITEIL